MDILDDKFKEIFYSQLVSIIGGLIAGTLIAVYANNLLLIPGMLIILPGFLEMRGNISGSLAARLTAGMFLGVVKPNRIRTKIVGGNVVASFILAIIVSLFLGLVAFAFNLFVLNLFWPKIIFLPLIAGIIANAIEIPITIFFTFYLFRRGHDPNDIMGPFITSTGDITSVLSLLFVAMVIL
ncbi:MAG: magnesium transporter [Candidatus Anstonellales archaeon]